jgi:hypothetical protein
VKRSIRGAANWIFSAVRATGVGVSREVSATTSPLSASSPRRESSAVAISLEGASYRSASASAIIAALAFSSISFQASTPESRRLK